MLVCMHQFGINGGKKLSWEEKEGNRFPTVFFFVVFERKRGASRVCPRNFNRTTKHS